MKELEAIIQAFDKATKSGLKCVLASVVHVKGSAYRRAGARMLIDENGMMTGAISGGCLEGDALRKALLALYQNKNKLITYDTSDENDAIIGAQLGCNGIIQVLFEPIDSSDDHNPVNLIKHIVESGETGVLISLFNFKKSAEQPGTFYSQIQNGEPLCRPQQKEMISFAAKASTIAFQQEHSEYAVFETDSGELNAFINHIPKPLQLAIIGAGNDAVALSNMAENLGWKISVQDGRPTHARTNRFSPNCQVMVSKPENALHHLKICSRTAVVLMSHNYDYDLKVLALLLDLPNTPYIGILGPAKKYQRMLEDLEKQGIIISEQQLSTIYAPVGLRLGAETPEEIALSVLAEIQTVFADKKQNHLRDWDGPIHDRLVKKSIT